MDGLTLQFFSFSVLLLAGSLAGLFWDFYRVVRGRARPRGWAEDGGDLVFWLVLATLVGAALFFGNWGELRLYVAVGLAAGVGLYFGLASPVCLALLQGFFDLLAWVFRPLLQAGRALATFLQTGLAWLGERLLPPRLPPAGPEPPAEGLPPGGGAPAEPGEGRPPGGGPPVEG